jgi:F-type H+-transporting ATPase subunit epsilon
VPVSVRVVTPEREVWAGEASMVIARGTEGEVGILGGHAPMLARLAVGPLRIQRDEGEIQAVIDGGFLHVTSEDDRTRVDVLATNAELSTEIDLEAARRSKAELESRLAQRHDDADADAALARANARISLLASA